MLGDRGGRREEGKHIDCVCTLVSLLYSRRTLGLAIREGIIVLLIGLVFNLFLTLMLSLITLLSAQSTHQPYPWAP